MRRWDDANKLAGQTPRVQLASQIAGLQAVRRDVQDLTPPECAKPAQTALTTTMDSTIQGYIDFLAQKPEATVTADFTIARVQMEMYASALATIRGPIGQGLIALGDKGPKASVWAMIGPPASGVAGTVAEGDRVDVYQLTDAGVMIGMPDGKTGWVPIEFIKYPAP